MANVAILQQSHVFGLNHGVRNNITYLDEQTVLYPAGTQLVQYNIEQKTQRFVPITEGDCGISTLHIAGGGFGGVGGAGASSGQSQWAAVAVKSAERGPFAVVLDLQNSRKRKILLPHEVIQAKEFVSISFTNDAKHVIAQSGAPEWNLYYWAWEKTKLLAYTKSTTNNNSEIHQMTCNPFDLGMTQVCVTGAGVFRVFRFQDGNFKLINQQKPDKNILCHCWINDTRIIAGTEDAKLLIFDSGDLILEISYVVPASASMPNRNPSINSITSYTGGVMAGTSTGICVLFERSDDAYLYKKNKEFLLEDSTVGCIALSPAEDMAVCTLGRRNQMRPAGEPFHHGNIVGMDTCSRKPLIATCGTDKSVRIWNYIENSIEVIKFFEEEPLSISLHPSGLYVLVGFADALKLMNVLIDDIRPFWESNIRGSRECRFSNGGQYFASVYGSTIVVHSTWSFETIGNLKGHSGKVRSICWAADDSRLVSCGLDGNVFDWEISTLRRIGEVQCKGNLFTSACYSADSKAIYAVGSDGLIKEISDSHVVREFPTKSIHSHVLMSRSGKLFFAATTRGSIRAYKYPFLTDSGISEHLELVCHSAPVTRMRISFDDSHIFTCGEDGCLWIYKMTDKADISMQRGAIAKREKEWSFSDEILVTKSDLKDNQKLMLELRQRVEALRTDNETQLRLKDLNYGEKLKELTEKYMNEIEGLKALTGTLQNERETKDLNHRSELLRMKVGNKGEIDEMKSAFEAKISAESEKFQELTDRSEKLRIAWETQMSDMDQFHTSKVKEISEHYRKKVQDKVDEHAQLKQQYGKQSKEFNALMVEIEEDANDEILQIGYSFETKLKQEREALTFIKDENLSMRSRFESLTAEVDENKKALNKMFAEERRLNGIIKGLEKDIIGIKREMQERDETIQDKEKRIYDLKKKNQELEKFKFVLDYKIAELKKQVEPRELDIILLSKQIKEMDNEIHSYHKGHDALDTTIQDLMMKLKATQSERNAELEKRRNVKMVVRRIQNDAHSLWKVVEDVNQLKKHLIAIHHKYSEDDDEPQLKKAEESATKKRLQKLNAALAGEPKGEDLEEQEISVMANANCEALEEEMEQARQREHLERTAATLRHKLQKSEETRYAENLRIMQENVTLLSEINILRKDFEASKLRTQKLEDELQAREEAAAAAASRAAAAKAASEATDGHIIKLKMNSGKRNGAHSKMSSERGSVVPLPPLHM